jgi:hypothetical protein
MVDNGIGVRGIAAEGMVVRGIAADGIAVRGIAVDGIAVRGMGLLGIVNLGIPAPGIANDPPGCTELGVVIADTVEPELPSVKPLLGFAVP